MIVQYVYNKAYYFGHVQGFQVKEGLSCVLFSAIALRKSR